MLAKETTKEWMELGKQLKLSLVMEGVLKDDHKTNNYLGGKDRFFMLFDI